MTIDRKELYLLYIQWVEDVSEHNEWKSTFYPMEIVNQIARILEDNPNLTTNDILPKAKAKE